LHGSANRQRRIKTPLYARPHDLITADLGDFRPEMGKANTLQEKVKGNRFEPYDDRERNFARFFEKPRTCFVVGSTILSMPFSSQYRVPDAWRMTDGRTVSVGYAGANGQSYVAIRARVGGNGGWSKNQRRCSPFAHG